MYVSVSLTFGYVKKKGRIQPSHQTWWSRHIFHHWNWSPYATQVSNSFVLSPDMGDATVYSAALFYTSRICILLKNLCTSTPRRIRVINTYVKERLSTFVTLRGVHGIFIYHWYACGVIRNCSGHGLLVVIQQTAAIMSNIAFNRSLSNTRYGS